MSEEHAIHVIDTAFQRDHFDAAYLLASGGRGAFIDCGTSHALPRLLAAVESAGLGVDAIDWLILTHVHLDHAGGAGALMQRLPNARLLVHPRGAPHMTDPARLVAGATAVYGEEEMARSYGDIVPVAAERVVVAGDGHRLSLGGRELLCIDTPGHARHHLCVWDAAS
ncbi:MAG TPA: MBL fold metallo-hydrolase, partial [Stenotrophomonas sp.]|nr:MBL fold metallo-hydrolase [Stenotrophomonas sp.]